MASLTLAQELQDEFGSAYSQDFLEMPSVAETEAILPTCRNHYNAIDLYWMGPNGNVKFHLPPPLLFVGLRGASYRGLLMAKYEVVGTQYGTDQANAQWAFKGQTKWSRCRVGRDELDCSLRPRRQT